MADELSLNAGRSVEKEHVSLDRRSCPILGLDPQLRETEEVTSNPNRSPKDSGLGRCRASAAHVESLRRVSLKVAETESAILLIAAVRRRSNLNAFTGNYSFM